MNILIVAEKPALSRALAPFARKHWPDANITFIHASPYSEIIPVYPRGRPLRDYPLTAEPEFRLAAWEKWWSCALVVGKRSAVYRREMGEHLFREANLVVSACEPDHTGAATFETVVRAMYGDDRVPGCPALLFHDMEDETLQAALENLRPFGEIHAGSLAYGRMKRYFDWNWNANALVVLGEVQRRAGLPAGAPPLSKNSLQLLYGLRSRGEISEYDIVTLMSHWAGTGRYKQDGPWQPGIGSVLSTGHILKNLGDAGLLDVVQGEGMRQRKVSDRGHALLGLLHPDCEDPDLPFRLDAWCDQGSAAKSAIDRYIKTFFGKQMRFNAREA